MTKEIIIDGQTVKMKSSAFIPVLYADLFSADKHKVDFFADIRNVIDSDGNILDSTPILRLGYAMAVHANGNKADLPFSEWLEQFTLMGFMDVIEDIYLFWTQTSDTKSVAKKKNDQPNGK